MYLDHLLIWVSESGSGLSRDDPPPFLMEGCCAWRSWRSSPQLHDDPHQDSCHDQEDMPIAFDAIRRRWTVILICCASKLKRTVNQFSYVLLLFGAYFHARCFSLERAGLCRGGACKACKIMRLNQACLLMWPRKNFTKTETQCVKHDETQQEIAIVIPLLASTRVKRSNDQRHKMILSTNLCPGIPTVSPYNGQLGNTRAAALGLIPESWKQ